MLVDGFLLSLHRQYTAGRISPMVLAADGGFPLCGR
jgi:hypothetical protein